MCHTTSMTTPPPMMPLLTSARAGDSSPASVVASAGHASVDARLKWAFVWPITWFPRGTCPLWFTGPQFLIAVACIWLIPAGYCAADHSGAVQPLLDLRARSLTQASAPGPVRAVVAQRLQQLSHRCVGGHPGGFPHLLGRGAGRPHEESAVVVSVRRQLALAERVALLRH